MDTNISDLVSSTIIQFNRLLNKILFFDVGFGFPFLIAWLICGGIFFMIRLNFANIRLFKHAIDVVRGKYSSDKDPGKISHTEAIYTAALSTVGLGSVSGVAIAVVAGGPGAVVWMVIAGFTCMSLKFSEILMGHKYRTIKEDGEILGGPFNYIKQALAEKKIGKLGSILGVFYAIALFGTSLGAANMFQSNQTAEVLMDNFQWLNGHSHLIGLSIVIMVGLVIIGGMKVLAKVASAMVPFTTVFYLIAVLVIIVMNIDKLPATLYFMLREAFNTKAISGGIVGIASIGFARAMYSTEAGGGTSAIAHASAKTTESVRAGCAGFIEILFALFVCTFTGIAITITGVYKDAPGVGGILVIKDAFASVASWFPAVLAISVPFLAVTTIIAWSYYGSMAWRFVFGNRGLMIFRIIFLSATYYGAIAKDTGLIIELCDYIWLAATIPNILTLYILSSQIKHDLDKYEKKLKNKEFIVYSP